MVLKISIIGYLFRLLREAVEKKRLPLSDPDVMAAARPRIPRNSEYPIPPAKPFASANDIIMVDGRRYDTQVNVAGIPPIFTQQFVILAM